MQRTLNANYLEMFDSKLSDIDKLAEKIHVNKPTYTIVNETYVTENDGDGTPCVIPSYDKIITINLDFPTIDLNGWVISGHVIHDAKEKIVSSIGTFVNNDLVISYTDLPESYYTRNMSICDHCGVKNNKMDMYILKSENGDIKTVSSAHVSDFTSFTKILPIFEYVSSIESLMAFNPEKETLNVDTVANKSHSWYKTTDILPYAIYVIEKYGWVSKSNSQICESKRKASSEWFVDIVFNNSENVDVSLYEKQVKPIIDFYITHKDEFKRQISKSDLNYTIAESLEGDYINFAKMRKTAGMICYAVHQYNTLDISNTPNSEFIASVGDTVTVIGKLIFTKISVSYWGKGMYVSLNCDGNKIIFYTSINSASVNSLKMCSAGDMIQLTGTVKKQVFDSDGVKTTELTRIRIHSINGNKLTN